MFSQVIIVGRLTADPEMITTPSGVSICTCTVAVNRKRKDTDDDVAFVPCSVFGQPGETLAKYGEKGKTVLVSGYLRQENWTDRESGRKRSRLIVVSTAFRFMSSGRRMPDHGQRGTNEPPPPDVQMNEDEGDVPF